MMQTSDKMIKKIVKTVNEKYNIDCTINTRARKILIPRQIAMYFIYKHLNITLAANGHFFNRDHATVIHALKCVKNIISSKSRLDDDFKIEIKEIDDDLKRHLSLSKEELKKMDKRDEIMEIIENYNLLGLNYLKDKLVLIPT